MEEKEQNQESAELLQETEGFWNDPQKIMRLIDLLFLWEDDDPYKKRICS